jgi:hypothetical protein
MMVSRERKKEKRKIWKRRRGKFWKKNVGTAKGLSTKTQKHTQKQIEIYKPDDDISTRDGET